MSLKAISFGFFLIACVIVGYSEAWIGRAVYHNDAHPGKCFVNKDLIMNPGSTAKNPEGCSEIRCENADGHAQIVGCGAFAPPPNCEWTDEVDLHAAYPICCLRNFKCKDKADEPKAKELQNHLKESFSKP